MIGEDIGRLFEAQVNAGILAFIEQHPERVSFAHRGLYDRHRDHYDLHAVLARFIDKQNILDPANRDIARRTAIYYLWKGYVSGYHFLADYLEAIGGRDPVQVLYYQCSFAGSNSFNVVPGDEEDERGAWLGQLDVPYDASLARYAQAGEFLKADTLMLLKARRHHVLALDASVFSVKEATDVRDLSRIEKVFGDLLADVNYIQSKSVFSHLSIDADLGALAFSVELGDYFTAFMRRDKESTKVIQAASYARSFHRFLLERGVLSPEADLVANVVGYTDRGVNTMALRPDQFGLLDVCADIYKRYRGGAGDRKEEITAARGRVVAAIGRNAARSFTNGRDLVKKLDGLATDPRERMVEHDETIHGFMNSVGAVPDALLRAHRLDGPLTLRDAHAALLKRSLARSDLRYVFATGNPGIGKTTAVATYLKEHHEEGYLLFYASPRTQVNLDILDKFRRRAGEPFYHPRFLGLTTNADIIRDNNNVSTVQYASSGRSGCFSCQSVSLIDDETARANAAAHRKGRRHIEKATDRKLRATRGTPVGVLNSMCSAIPALIQSGDYRAIAAAVSVQALKRTGPGADTLKHFEKLFASAYNEKTGRVFPDRMRAISAKVRNIFIMIDEITGDDAGVEFLRRIVQIINRYELDKHGFNCKIIVSDASIVDPGVIGAHLSLANASPEPDKIFFRKVAGGSAALAPLTMDEFSFAARDGAMDAVVINTNSYPANSLTLGYRIALDRIHLDDAMTPEAQKEVIVAALFGEDGMRDTLVRDIATRLEEMPRGDQLIVYIQNKERLREVIAAVVERRRGRGATFEREADYLEIHANTSDDEKAAIGRLKDDVSVVFMTSSASRGLSFPRTRHILVEVPRFSVENNLMEIIQVIYRGRGDDVIDRMDKGVVFYISDLVVVRADDRDAARESILSTLNLLILLKAAIMTRIAGAGRIRDDLIGIIPIGGKSVAAAGQAYHDQIADFTRKLGRESHTRYGDIHFDRVYEAAQKVFGHVDIRIPVPDGVTSYLSLRRECTPERIVALLDRGGRLLRDLPPLQPAHVGGGLLIMPVTDPAATTSHLFPLAQVIQPYVTEDLRRSLDHIIAHTAGYPRGLSSGAKLFLELVDEIRDAAQSQALGHAGQRLHAYVAIPLSAFVAGDAYGDYFQDVSRGDRSDDLPFRGLLHQYLLALSYPVDTALPIGSRYKEFPFLSFTSNDLAGMRRRMFAEGYLLMSNEMNILNMLLAQSSKDGGDV